MVFVRAGVCMWVGVCLQGSLRSWMMAERKLLGMRLPCPPRALHMKQQSTVEHWPAMDAPLPLAWPQLVL